MRNSNIRPEMFLHEFCYSKKSIKGTEGLLSALALNALQNHLYPIGKLDQTTQLDPVAFQQEALGCLDGILQYGKNVCPGDCRALVDHPLGDSFQVSRTCYLDLGCVIVRVGCQIVYKQCVINSHCTTS